ncbi:hypothetical protein EMIHUDRAFT_243970 [Emiliania huxleyi CCMP1516]|uniref:Homeobox domain-containing protein n=2 Tax=Emiliania huxleyi TaxID=2903 RepID=A0A0D3J241_EMIH1|nr:hypothetical protein EMIHUDRAFT_243970 [Emiliania huxleyi CCMP1516]EOD17576.1 hypothetical protein EMIHUDRAFT_243970 [Emiliania huxleyi CCMP1516]|eukprot:XP_005770005.1 hypothetical protein EMIHUDRAFT_243970 [Emiliania huxleyi CCMP1516]
MSSPRWIVDGQSRVFLEQVFASDQFPSRHLRTQLADKLSVTARQVQVWFQNRRQKAKKIRVGCVRKRQPRVPVDAQLGWDLGTDSSPDIDVEHILGPDAAAQAFYSTS